MEGWIPSKLGEIVTLKRGYDLPERLRKSGPYPIVSSSGISDFHSEFKLKGPGVITGRYGTLGLIHYVSGKYWPLNTTLYVQDFKKNDPKYIYYFFQTLNLEEFNAAAAVPGLDRNVLHKINCLFPKDLIVQQRVASILSTYDDLIEVNNQRIKLLEQTARELYKEWFVRMRFPGYKEVKFEKGIPEGWKVKKLGKVVELAYGKALKDENRNGGKYPVYGSSGIVGFHNSFIATAPGIVVGRKGNVGSVFWVTENFYAIDTAFYVKTSFNLYYIYFNLLSQHFIEADAAVPGLSRNQAYSNFILLPDDNLIKRFDSIIEPIFLQLNTLEQQNTQLRQIRDRLLPRLISGKLHVKTNAAEAKIIPINPIKFNSEETDSINKTNPYFKRRVLAAYLIDNLKDEITFGHVKLMKLMYLCEHLAQVETLSNYHRDAAGPYDNQMIRSIDSQLNKAKWFACVKTEQKYTYIPLEKKDEYKEWFAKYYAKEEPGIESLVSIFGNKKTIEAEKVATLYEAYRFLREKNRLFTDKDILHEVLNNWHESKQRIPENEWQACLNWMREKNWVN